MTIDAHVSPPKRCLDPQSVEKLSGVFDEFEPWSGEIVEGRRRNFMGVVQPREMAHDKTAGYFESKRPDLSSGEGYAEWYSTYRSILRAKGSYAMVSLGAHFGGPLVNAYKMVQAMRPMPCRLIGIEGDPHMCSMLRRHAEDNGLPADCLTLINAVVSEDNKPILFPTSPVRTGANRALSTRGEIETVCDVAAANGHAVDMLRGLLTSGRSGLFLTLPGTEARAELQASSAVTVNDIIGPLDHVDYLEIDIQSTEIRALPPFMDLLKRRVGWIHLGTHGHDVHAELGRQFRDWGFSVEIDWLPETDYETPHGPFRTQDGVLALSNPAFDPRRA